MLIYHPAFDAYHCLFRMIALIDHVQCVEVDKARILDFYLTFPSLVATIRMPPTLSYAKKTARLYSNVYHDPISPRSTFKDMYHIQNSALKCLVATGLIELKDFENGKIYRTDLEIPDALLLSMSVFLNKKKDVYDFILESLSSFHLTGRDGLKDRTNLMEFRYDFS
ncbi:TPA: hypothetical protein PXN84_003222 [Yersinia enterocolitica]|nr:hypothetical protein [Yersinia enterocolitica]HDL7433314.1 hypothetical protein [Yersinia enterocolitica]HDL7475723.1 hypothetical protein [Yersinia enterocolitica]